MSFAKFEFSVVSENDRWTKASCGHQSKTFKVISARLHKVNCRRHCQKMSAHRAQHAQTEEVEIPFFGWWFTSEDLITEIKVLY